MSESIYGDKQYLKYSFELGLNFPVVLAIAPLLYIVPTVLVIVRIFYVFVKTLIWKTNGSGMDSSIFFIITTSHLMNLLFFMADFLMYRLPATGALTPWCSRTAPSKWLALVVFLSFYSAYAVMLFPSALSLIRLLLIISPYSRFTSLVLKCSPFFIFLYPFFFTFFLIPATGICKPLDAPYPFGAVMIYYYGSYRGIHNSPIYLSNIVIWMVVGAVINAMLLLKLTSFKFEIESLGSTSKTRSAEFSITVTTVSMLLSALLNCIFVVFYLTIPTYIDYLTIVKPIGSDCEVVVSPWIFYFTHPIFGRNRKSAKLEDKSKIVRIATV